MPEMTGVRKCKGKNLRLIIPNEFVIGTIGILFFLFAGEAGGESFSPICVEDYGKEISAQIYPDGTAEDRYGNKYINNNGKCTRI